MKVWQKFLSEMALTHFWPEDIYYHEILAATEMHPAFENPATHKKYIWFTSWWLLDGHRLGLKVFLVFLKFQLMVCNGWWPNQKKETMDSEASKHINAIILIASRQLSRPIFHLSQSTICKCHLDTNKLVGLMACFTDYPHFTKLLANFNFLHLKSHTK